ncbi:MAG: Putative stress response protein (Modular protein) [Nitrospira sp.]|nr:CsbD family protein [Nitrospira sp.]ULA58669.1 MAG: Putative stress response protein (Modular protein) [Nitrospira sp.]
MTFRHGRLFFIMLTGMAIMTGVGQAGEEVFLREGHEMPILAVNQDQLEGKWKQFKGELKQQWAAFTDDDLMLIEGRIDTLEGKIQERYGDRREEVKRWVDEWFERHGENANQS